MFCYAFPIFMSIFEKLWISPQNQSLLRCRIPKNVLETQKILISAGLGTVTYGAQVGWN